MVKFVVEFWWKMLLTIFPSKRSSKISCQTSPEVRHQFHRELRQLHSGNRWCLPSLSSGPEKGVITKGVFSFEESLKSLDSLESLENGRVLLCFPQSGCSLESLNSLESLENGLFWKDPFSKRPLFPNPISALPNANTKSQRFSYASLGLYLGMLFETPTPHVQG